MIRITTIGLLFVSFHYAYSYDETWTYGSSDSYLGGLRILDCYGIEDTETIEEQNKHATLVNSTPTGKIINIDPNLQRPCFFSAQYKGTADYTAMSKQGLLMLSIFDHSEDPNWKYANQNTGTVHVGYTTDAGQGNACSGNPAGCGIANFLTNGDMTDQDGAVGSCTGDFSGDITIDADGNGNHAYKWHCRDAITNDETNIPGTATNAEYDGLAQGTYPTPAYGAAVTPELIFAGKIDGTLTIAGVEKNDKKTPIHDMHCNWARRYRSNDAKDGANAAALPSCAWRKAGGGLGKKPWDARGIRVHCSQDTDVRTAYNRENTNVADDAQNGDFQQNANVWGTSHNWENGWTPFADARNFNDEVFEAIDDEKASQVDIGDAQSKVSENPLYWSNYKMVQTRGKAPHGDFHPTNGHKRLSICSTILKSIGVDNSNSIYKDPNNIGVIGSGYENDIFVNDNNAYAHYSDGNDVKVEVGERLFWQAGITTSHLKNVNTATAGDKNYGFNDADAIRMSFVMGQELAMHMNSPDVIVGAGLGIAKHRQVNTLGPMTALRSSPYVTWASGVDTNGPNEPMINQHVLSIWVKAMPPLDAAFSWTEFTAYTGEFTASNCTDSNCPVTVQDPDTYESWVGLSVKTPNINEATGSIYVGVSSEPLNANGNIKLKLTYGGLTKVPAGTCTKNSTCHMSVFYHLGNEARDFDVNGQRFFVTGNGANACSNVAGCTTQQMAGNAEGFMCLWPNYGCVKASPMPEQDNQKLYNIMDDQLDKTVAGQVVTPDMADTKSLPTIWKTMNGQADGTLAPVSGDEANIIHVTRSTNKTIFAETTGTSQNQLPIILQKVQTRNRPNEDYTGFRGTDANTPGIQGIQSIAYPMTALSDNTDNGTTKCVDRISSGTALQQGCGRDYHFYSTGTDLVCGGDTCDPDAYTEPHVAIHEWSRSNLFVKLPTDDKFNVMQYSHSFTDDGDDWELEGVVETQPHKWFIYAQSANDSANADAITGASGVKLNARPRFVKLYEEIREYRTYTADGGSFITGVQLGSRTATLANSAGWFDSSGVGLRTLVANASLANVGGTTNSSTHPVAVAKYAFSPTENEINMGLLMQNPSDTVALKAGKLYIINASKYAEDAPLIDGFGGVQGGCSRPTWSSVTTNNIVYETNTPGNAAGLISIDTINQDQCAGLSNSNDDTLCEKIEFRAGNDLVRGEYELWYQNSAEYFFYKQTNAEATFTVVPYTASDTQFVDANAVQIAGSGEANSPELEWSYDSVADVLLKYKKRDSGADVRQDDQRGFMLFNKSFYVVPLTLPSSVKVTDLVTTSGLYYDFVHSDCIFDGSDIDTNLTAGVDVKACIKRYGTGTYDIWVQVDGSENYVEQSASFRVKFGGEYELTNTDVLKTITWRNARVNEETKESAYTFDATRQAVCDVNEVTGNKYTIRHSGDDVEDKRDSMQLTLEAGNTFLPENLCYIQIFDASGKPVTTPNGRTPEGLETVYHWYEKVGDANSEYITLSQPCQNGTTAAARESLANGDSTGNANYHQIPAVVAGQFKPGYSIKLWVRETNKKWALQGATSSQMTFDGFSGAAPSGLITSVTHDLNQEGAALEVAKVGSNQKYIIKPIANASDNKDEVVMCMKPVSYGIEQKNYFHRYSDESTVYCYDQGLETGNNEGQTVTINFMNNHGHGMPPGQYRVLSNYLDGSEQDACKTWADEGLVVSIGWKRDTKITANHLWGALGITTVGGSQTPVPTVIRGSGTASDPKLDVMDDRLRQQFDNLNKAFRSGYLLTIEYQTPLFLDKNHWVYWTTDATGACDCVGSYCTDMTSFEVGFLGWPNVGSPNCQHHKAKHETIFPATGKYYMCVTKTVDLRGWPVETNVDTVRVPVSVSINPTEAPAVATPTGSMIGSPSSAVATLFALTVALIGALLL